MVIVTFSQQLFLVSVFHHVSDTNKTRLKIYTKIPPSGQILHAFSDNLDFILLVTFSQKVIFNSLYTEKNNCVN